MERLPAILAFASASLILALSFEKFDAFYRNNPVNGPPFYHPIHRPISVSPTSDLRTKFNIYTPANPEIPQILNASNESISNTILDANYPTKVIIHGYNTDLNENDARFMIKDELLREGQYNVIIVNWTENNKSPYYQAVANARVVGAQVAKLLNFHVANRGFEPQNMHVIGHSLGGQMAGWVGERIPLLGRITGLDPAGPYFQDAENEVRLDTTDADFVDIIHSNGGDTIVGGALGCKADVSVRWSA
ncbi:pancreatic triacylglycerol lipase-like [Uloborus diversus]|uniref:pancreatic triacylglycerol lipase-like n=1 Tax=Uloborus diversus TaxID=327109 RepID=UPI0024095274|nr:pancreatic triacylglycerol lipase-like [Uloborus diversus]